MADPDATAATDLDEIDALSRTLATRALAPERPRLVECLVRLTGAPERVCREATYAAARGQSPLRWVLGKHFAAGSRAFEGLHDASEAWESIAPEGWLGDPSRVYVTVDGALVENPASVRDALVLASDPVGVCTAEALAREVRSRAALVFGAAPARVAWRVVESRRFRAHFFAAKSGGAGSDAERLFRALTLAEATPLTSDPSIAARVRRETVRKLAGCGWDLGTLVEYAHAARAAREPDPFGPLVELFRTGYALDELRDDALVLACPGFVD